MSVPAVTPIFIDPSRDPWSRQPDEPDRAYEAFTVYRDLGFQRSMSKVQELLSDASHSTLDTWSKRWRWQERVSAWDASIEEEYRAQLVKDRRDMAKNHMKLARSIQNKLVTRLNNMTDAEIAKITVPQIAQLLDVASKVERQALGAPDVIHEHIGDGGPIRHEQVAPTDAVRQAAHDFLTAMAEAQEEIRAQARESATIDGEVIDDAEIVDESDDDFDVERLIGGGDEDRAGADAGEPAG